MLHMGLSTLKLIELDSECIEDAPDAGVVREHQSTYFVRCSNIWAFLG